MKSESEAFSISGYQHVGFSRTAHGGGVALLIQDGIGVMKGPEVSELEVVTATFVLPENLSFVITSA